mgnify:CR=1 FL=1|tara:strand:+ start:137 stop:418 length:282 start_codon:yes stop_codon:yes gene_type:complete
MADATFNVVWSKATKNGNWHTKLFTEEISESVDQGGIFGTNDKVSQKTLFVFGSKEVTVDSVTLDPDSYRIKTVDYVLPDGEIIELSYLNGLK